VVWYFCFWAIWAAGPVLKKKLGADYEQLFEGSFSMGNFFFFNFKKHALKSCILFLFLNFFWTKNRLMLKFLSLSVLHKGLLMQDWVFRLGLRHILTKYNMYKSITARIHTKPDALMFINVNKLSSASGHVCTNILGS